MFQQIRGQNVHFGFLNLNVPKKNTNLAEDAEIAAILVFLSAPKHKLCIEDVEILFPATFGWIPFGGFRGEVENV